MAPNLFRLTRIDVIVSLQDPEYYKVNQAAIKKRMKENQGKRMPNKKNAASSPSIGSTLASTSPSIGSTLSSTSTTKIDIPELLEIFKAIIASLKGFDVTFVMQRKLTKTDLEPNNIQLAMPEKQINEECKFLAHKDAMIVRILEARDGKGQLIGMKVGLIEPSGEVCHDQVLKKWNMTSASTYNLVSSSWCDIVRRNHLKKDHLLNIWGLNDAANKFYFLLHHVGSEPFEPCNEIKT
ncbi:hypothetical protein AHAS_Ahas17G0118800 [Arachis hypogaea]